MGGPLVSVIVPAFNAERTIARAIESVRAQTYRPLEIVAVNDASADGTLRRLLELAGDDLRVVNLPTNQGASAARNAGIRAATGDYVAFLDADDEWLPEKLERQVAMMEAEPALSFSTCDARQVMVDGARHPHVFREVQPESGKDAWKALLAYTFVGTPCVLARRSAVLEAGGFDESLKVAEDQDLWIKLALKGDVGILREPLVVIHRVPDSLQSSTADIAVDCTLAVVSRHLEAQRHRLTARERRFILGYRLHRLGRVEYLRAPRRGARLLLRSVLLGYRPLAGLAYLLTSSGPARRLRRPLLD